MFVLISKHFGINGFSPFLFFVTHKNFTHTTLDTDLDKAFAPLIDAVDACLREVDKVAKRLLSKHMAAFKVLAEWVKS